ncbi:hypothetical protein BCY84_18526 [Trypanosoma cruzi cruzi]|nr:hypothetical protein BCY84_18526 [Trypanosoma cruzi cruzi]
MCAAFLISASYDKQIRFWDGASGRTVRCFSFQDSQVNALLLIPDTTYLVVAGFGVVRVYDIGAPSAAAAASVGGGGVSSQAPPLLSSYENQSAMNVTSLGSFPLNLHKGVITLFGSSNDNSNSSLFNATADFVSTQQPYQENPSGELSTALYATSEDGHIRFFNAASPTTLQLIWDIPTGAAITCSALSPDRQTLFTGSQIGRVSVWHLPTIIEVATLQAKSTIGIPFGQAPLQVISFDTDYTAIRSIAIEPLARWAVAATNAGKLHFMRFTRELNASVSLADLSCGNANKPECGEKNETEQPVGESGIPESREVSGNGGTKAPRDANVIQLEDVHQLPNVGKDVDANELKSAELRPTFTLRENLTPVLAHSPDPQGILAVASPSEQDAHTNYHSNAPSLQTSLLPEQFLLEVFYSFQAHYKYILKVAISPSTDLLVTCCADYTVGRFLIPKELQNGTAFAKKSTGHEASSSCESVPAMSATAAMGSDGEGLQARRMAQQGAPEVALAVASLLQPMAGGEEAPNSSADKREGADVKALETPQNGNDRRILVDAGDGTAAQPAAKKEEKGGASPGDFPDASSLQFSVVPSLTMEGNTQLHSTGVLQFIALKPLTGHLRWVWDCVFSDCGRFLFTASSDHYLRMWTGLLTDRVQSTCFVGHTKPVVCCILYYEKRCQ